ncbi:bifunctional 23S rRNA (guanine(2069)-N(7))-methyltransferase RlmK/23S rRNA (guanine(2445)-N(2))-methyltransferase RlmL [Halomonas urumqiensis]|uniref:Ribosomal RNA large subunit methyltransferase K/L n=1 Tax=Halomonas urumqiensis TaxID=1684789 RepID=A0A2N7UDT2_9GAMM|nr:bifunctional 23S rRNA (guanine(2069)-N(7))-methyltransferase RlmK/23S rRNA (guanine(2445)-N(2))-methyltransferase RlmL [Halomonas urumqiensis]PMR78612.1 bifunctional 23S rRNA (guanine(2069)-N(7))-methyltransferase RlmK/23S rRNA (guanine(2445)-N(2))-methyltransferase RlmL [Halomonas urumqiensis]PTB03756.1 bifunctional 23S rRNA (guanine(2069)-N(7))-methyltransferase RlmK/23S rRNA (guanine(2445)-N(2))-methyltransferase RlmL [Halomonas urumqiensis]GHE20018.1 ribosomal RNA large subunit methyltran
MSEPLTTKAIDFIATCPRGIELLLADELVELGAQPGKTTVGGVHFRGDLAAGYRACLWSRLANRIVLCLAREEGIETPELLRAVVAGIDWREHLAPGASLAVDFHGRSEAIRHTRFGAQTVKDGVVDRLQAEGLARPDIDLVKPDLRLYAHLHRGRLTVGVDLSGDSLHRRGYRRDVGHAPLKENLAAALLIRAGWPSLAKQGAPLVDPLCGAGTLLIEAAMIAADMAPNLNRERFGLHGWAGHDAGVWRELVREAEARASIGRKRCRARLLGFDQSPPALSAARANAMRAGIPALIEFKGAGLGKLTRPTGLDDALAGLVITNPPYGERLGELPELVALYGLLGERVRQAFPGWTLAVFTANPDLGHRIGLRAHKQYALRNGPLEAKLLLMAVPEGVKRHDDQAADARSATSPDASPDGGVDERSEQARGPARSEGAQMFANRLEKNRRRLKKWLKRSGEPCYRLYDADMPEYALAIDVYGDRAHVQEYAPPKTIDAAQAQKRLFDALAVIPEVLEIDPGKVVIKRRERQGGRAQYQKQATSGERFEVREGRARLWVNLRDYLDTGLFLDHRPVRRLLGEMAAGRRFLNLFCYTATATVQAALGSEKEGGASDSVSVDLSNTYLEWARDNFALNRLDPGRHRVVRDDCLRWLETANGQFDLIFMDPPTFSNSKKMDDTLDIQRDHGRLVRLAMARLAPGGTLVFSNNQRRFKLDADLAAHYAVEDISAKTFDPDFNRRPDLHHVFLIRHREAA